MVLNVRAAGCPSSGYEDRGIDGVEGTLVRARDLAGIGLQSESLMQYDHVAEFAQLYGKLLWDGWSSGVGNNQSTYQDVACGLHR